MNVKDILKSLRNKKYKDASFDMLCELALCLKYSKRIPYEYQQAKHYINTKIPKKSILLSTEKTNNLVDDIINNEHTNALYVLLEKENRFLK